MNKELDVTMNGGVALVELRNPPVNAWSLAQRSAFATTYDRLCEDDSVRAIVITGAGKAFCAGADIAEFASGQFHDSPHLMDVLQRIYNAGTLTIAAINGVALGGGLETALACHYRIASQQARLGVPEVHLGLLPGAGGTQALPRVAGAKAALDMIVSGKPVSATEALGSGLVDAVHDGDADFREAAIAYAQELLAKSAPLRSAKDAGVDTSGIEAGYFDNYRASIARRTRGFLAPGKCIDAVEAACQTSFTRGLAREAELFRECLASPQARAQQHLFFAEREAGKIPGVADGTELRPLESIAIIGSGTMGGGIAMNFMQAGIPVTMLDLDADALERGVGTIRKNYEISASKGRMSVEQVDACMQLLSTTTSYAELSDADLVIEAVFEDMGIKKKVFASLDAVCKPGAILATNTSTLDINEIAASTKRSRDVIGLHFFSPANVMRLLEIVRAADTAPEVIASCLDMAKRIRKQAVVVGVCFGFVGNRMFEPYIRESHRLVLEGASPAQVDRVLYEFGMAMGPLSVSDLAGNDIGYLVRESRRDEIAHDPGYNLIGDRLVALGRNGQKSGRGFYIYEGRNKQDDPEVIQLAEEIAAELGIERREIPDTEILERCIYPLINEGAEILRDGIAYRSGDIDIVWTNGYGFPAHRGGPMQYADEIGLDRVVDGMNKYRESLGAYGEMWFKPSPLLVELTTSGRLFQGAKAA